MQFEKTIQVFISQVTKYGTQLAVSLLHNLKRIDIFLFLVNFNKKNCLLKNVIQGMNFI